MALTQVGECDDIVFVGGVAKTPMLRKMMEKAFGEDLIRYSAAVNSDEVVAYGAAVQGSVLMASYLKNAPAFVETSTSDSKTEKGAVKPPSPPSNKVGQCPPHHHPPRQ